MSPAMCGLFRPAILLPHALAEQLPPNQLRAVLLHELAHLKRGDVWMNCAQVLLQIVYWWHPLLWLANARIRRVREEAVDDAVMLALRDEAESYAPTLLEVAKLAFHRPLATLGLIGIMESRNSLRQRIERLVNLSLPKRAGLSVVSLLGIVAFTALAVPMGEAPMKPTKSSPPAQISNILPFALAHDGSPEVKEQNPEISVESTRPDGVVQYDIATGITSATNGVIFKSGGVVVTSDSITVNQQTGEVVAVGHVRIDSVMTGDRVRFRLAANANEKPAGDPGRQASTSLDAQPKPPATPPQLPDGVLAFDDETKEAPVKAGESEARFTFNLTNVSASDVVISNVVPSCGCTVAKLPTTPWQLVPGAHGQIPVVMNVAGKSGVLTKTLTINSDKGAKVLTIKAAIQPATTEGTSKDKVAAKLVREGRLLLEQGKLDEAETELERATVIDPQNKAAFYYLNLVRETRNAKANGQPLPPQQNRSASRNGDNLKRALGANGDNSTNLYVRTYKVDPDTFDKGLESVALHPIAQTNAALAMRTFVASLGVDLNPELGKTIYFKDRTGLMLVRATRQDLDIIEAAIQVLNTTSSQVNIKVKFVEVPVRAAEKLLATIFTNAPVGGTNGFTGILTRPQAEKLMKAIESTKGADILNAPEVTTLSGRQAQIQNVELRTIVIGLTPVFTNGVTNLFPRTDTMPFGSVLDVTPHVSADGYTIQMTLVPTVTEFLGYEDPPNAIKTAGGGQLNNNTLPLPRFRVRQITTTAVVWDGQTLVLGNFPDKEVTKLPTGKDEVRDAASKSKKQLLVFVTPTIVDQGGNRMHAEEEMPFAQESVPSQAPIK